MFESMILKVIAFFVDVGDWFKKNFFLHNPHQAEKVEETIEATPEVKSAKEFMQQSIETVAKAEEELKAKIIEDVKQVEDVVAKYKAELAETIKEEIAEVAEFVEEKATKVKKATRKTTKKEQED